MEKIKNEVWKKDFGEFKKKQISFMQESWIRLPIKAFPDGLEAMRRKTERQACFVCEWPEDA